MRGVVDPALCRSAACTLCVCRPLSVAWGLQALLEPLTVCRACSLRTLRLPRQPGRAGWTVRCSHSPTVYVGCLNGAVAGAAPCAFHLLTQAPTLIGCRWTRRPCSSVSALLMLLGGLPGPAGACRVSRVLQSECALRACRPPSPAGGALPKTTGAPPHNLSLLSSLSASARFEGTPPAVRPAARTRHRWFTDTGCCW